MDPRRGDRFRGAHHIRAGSAAACAFRHGGRVRL